jgi:putative acetyltransferase
MVRRYRQSDLNSIFELFHDTVHAINARDYSEEQLDAWAPAVVDLDTWHQRLHSSVTYVSVENSIVIGFGNLTEGVWIDMLYTHKEYQRKGVASSILSTLIQVARSENLATLHTESSITAKPFFEMHGFYVEKEQEKAHNGSAFRNFVMKKELPG